MDLRRWLRELRGGEDEPTGNLAPLLDLVATTEIFARIGRERADAFSDRLRVEAREAHEAAISLLRFGGEKFEDVALLNEAKEIVEDMERGGARP